MGVRTIASGTPSAWLTPEGRQSRLDVWRLWNESDLSAPEIAERLGLLLGTVRNDLSTGGVLQRVQREREPRKTYDVQSRIAKMQETRRSQRAAKIRRDGDCEIYNASACAVHDERHRRLLEPARPDEEVIVICRRARCVAAAHIITTQKGHTAREYVRNQAFVARRIHRREIEQFEQESP